MLPYLSHCWELFPSLTEEVCLAVTMGELGWAGSSSEEAPEAGIEEGRTSFQKQLP